MDIKGSLKVASSYLHTTGNVKSMKGMGDILSSYFVDEPLSISPPYSLYSIHSIHSFPEFVKLFIFSRGQTVGKGWGRKCCKYMKCKVK